MLKKKIKILSLDPGSRHIGYALFEDNDLVDYGVRTVRKRSQDIMLDHIEVMLKRWFKEFKPDYLALEKNQFSEKNQNARLTRVMGRMRYTAKRAGVPAFELAHATIRKELTGDGHANKRRIAEAIIIYYRFLKVHYDCEKQHVRRYNQKMFDAVAVGCTFIRMHMSSVQPISPDDWR